LGVIQHTLRRINALKVKLIADNQLLNRLPALFRLGTAKGRESRRGKNTKGPQDFAPLKREKHKSILIVYGKILPAASNRKRAVSYGAGSNPFFITQRARKGQNHYNRQRLFAQAPALPNNNPVEKGRLPKNQNPAEIMPFN
jgi:hypothetical protein